VITAMSASRRSRAFGVIQSTMARLGVELRAP
jgi:hypothetical protein